MATRIIVHDLVSNSSHTLTSPQTHILKSSTPVQMAGHCCWRLLAALLLLCCCLTHTTTAFVLRPTDRCGGSCKKAAAAARICPTTTTTTTTTTTMAASASSIGDWFTGRRGDGSKPDPQSLVRQGARA